MELRKYKLSEICDILSGGTPSTNNEDYWDGDIPWLSVKDFGNVNKWVSDTEKFITRKGLDNCPSSLLQRGDLILSARGTVGKVAMVSKSMAFNQSCFGLRAKEELITKDFLFYWFSYNQQIFKGAQQGNVFKSVTLDFFDNTFAVIPDLEYQRKFCSILSSIDDKINLNHAINQNLEALAKQIYDYWFVQFDFPDENGRPYKSSGGQMVYSDKLKREIPLIFDVKSIGDHTEVLLGGTPDTKNSEYWNGEYPWLNSGEVAEFPLIKSESTITQKGLDCSATAYAPKGSVTLSITRHLRPSILAINACINQSVVAIKETALVHKEYLYPFMVKEIPRLMTLRTGAQQPHINKETVESTWLTIPTSDVLEKYYLITKPIFDSIINNAFEIESLTKQRDELLPLLMNGQVSIK